MSARGKGKRPYRKRTAQTLPQPPPAKQTRQSAAATPEDDDIIERISLSVDDSGFLDNQTQDTNPGNVVTSSSNNVRAPVIDFEQILRESGIVNNQSENLQTQNAQNISVFPNVVSNNSGSLGVGSGQSITDDIEAFRCGDDDMVAHVPHSICQKIWQNQYINIALLNKGSIELHALCAASVLSVNQDGTLEAKPKACNEKVATVEKWTDAFLIFMAVYLKKHPERTAEMLQYMSVIREAASRGGGMAWRTYDEQFRLRQAMCLQSWGRINADLWLRVMSMPSAAAGGGNRTFVPNQKVKAVSNANPCFDFNKGFCSWNNCKYQHVCSICGASGHNKGSCFRGQTGSGQQAFAGRGRARGFGFRPRGGGRPFGARGRGRQVNTFDLNDTAPTSTKL